MALVALSGYLIRDVVSDRFFLRTPTELVMLRQNGIPLPEWEWNQSADFTQGITTAWQVKQE